MAAEREIDHSLYSRQYYVYGKEAMEKMAKSTVLLSGLDGVGVEIAKNVALAGVREIVLHDRESLSLSDLSTQFFASEQQIGKNRAHVSAEKVKELNPYTLVSVETNDVLLDLNYLKRFSVVCLCNQPQELQIAVDDLCRANGICFLSVEARGLFVRLFVDVGNDFSVYDKDGEELKEVIIGGLTKGKTTQIRTLPNGLHLLEKGNWVTFREVKGPSHLNDGKYYVVSQIDSADTFTVDADTSDSPDYVEGTGVVQQVKEVIKVSHRSMRESLQDPELLLSDLSKLEAPAQIHLGWRAVNEFLKERGRWPEAWNEDDAASVVAEAEKINKTHPSPLPTVDGTLLSLLSKVWRGQFSPIATFIGGSAGQEVLKCVSGKFTPLQQYLYLDFREIAPSPNTPLSLSGSRYDSQVICIGAEASRILANARLFVVGSGAIGCELMKILAMMGCSTGEKGSLTLTDDDNIERSNLNRQFLFRDYHIGKPKSETAKGSILSINASMQIDAHKRRVDPKSEDVYTNAFFEGLDCVLNALDNVEARRYVDHRITVAQRPLVESGTMGTKGHVQVIVPFKTETYGQQNDPASKDVPFCTVKFFPHEINHCVQWARALAFQNNFVEKPKLFRQFLETDKVLDILRSPRVRQLKPWILVKLLDRRPASFADCVTYARHKWERYFNHAPRHLLALFPPNHTVDGGKLFWANPKRLPHPLEYSLNDPLHVQFVIAFANVWAHMWGIEYVRDEKVILDLIKNAPVPPFIAKKKSVETDESVSAQKAEEAKQDKVSEEAIAAYVERLEKFLQSGSAHSLPLTPIEFEKDDDTNFHIDCIHAIANLRARVYRIPEVDRYETKKIAGRIIPAIAATTAVVSGLAGVELLKILLSLPFDKYKSAFLNLALPQFTLTEPGEVKKERITKNLYTTIWDRWDVHKGKEMTLSDFIDFVSDKWKIEPGAIFMGSFLIWNGLMPKHKTKLPMKMVDLIKDAKNLEYADLLVVVEEEEEEDEEGKDEEEGGGPTIRLYFD